MQDLIIVLSALAVTLLLYRFAPQTYAVLSTLGYLKYSGQAFFWLLGFLLLVIVIGNFVS